jgi:NAD(P)-dependent dehydrogenase (short-subunit alcohol dehydrogenase family)
LKHTGSVIVAGAGRGIGAAIAIAFARSGARKVAILGRTASELDAVAAAISECGAEPLPIVCDVTQSEERSTALAAAGDVEVFVYSAGTNRPGPFVEVSEESFDALFDLNVRAGFFLAQGVAQRMLQTGIAGRLIFLSSQMGHVGAANRTVYCSSKHAVEGLVKSIAVELAPAGIRVISVAPTFVRTAMTAGQLDDPELGRAIVDQIPLGRLAGVDDVAEAVVWAASPAAAMVTGTSIRVDGGWTAR